MLGTEVCATEECVLGTKVCATELRRRVGAGNRGVCNRAEEKGGCWEQRCVQQS